MFCSPAQTLSTWVSQSFTAAGASDRSSLEIYSEEKVLTSFMAPEQSKSELSADGIDFIPSHCRYNRWHFLRWNFKECFINSRPHIGHLTALGLPFITPLYNSILLSTRAYFLLEGDSMCWLKRSIWRTMYWNCHQQSCPEFIRPDPDHPDRDLGSGIGRWASFRLLLDRFMKCPSHQSCVTSNKINPRGNHPFHRLPMSIFDAYDQEFSSLSRDISKNLGEFKAAANAGWTSSPVEMYNISC